MNYSMFGNIETLPLRRRIFIIASFYAVILCLFSALLNFYFSLHYLDSIIPLFSALFFSVIFYRAKRTNLYLPLVWVFICISIISLSVVWIYNDGYNSSHSLLILNTLMISLMISVKKQRVIIFGLYFIIMIALNIIQYNFPELFVPYESEKIRFSDILFSTIYNMLVLFLLVNYVLNNYDAEQIKVIRAKRKTEKLNNNLKEKNQLISDHVIELDELNIQLSEVNYEISRQNQKLENFNNIQHELNHEIVINNKKLESLNKELNSANSEKDKLIKTLHKELNNASKYVISLFPKPNSEGIIKTDWLYVPSSGLGGDAFGYNKIDSTHFAAYLLDVSGHGVGAALHSVQVLNILQNRTLPNVDFRNPEEVLNALNKIFKMSQYSDLYFTIGYAVYNRKTSILKYAGAGHPPLLLINGNEELSLNSQNIFIGAIENAVYKSEVFTIEKSSTLYFFSDGVFEIEKPNKEMYTFLEFRDTLTRYHTINNNSLEELYQNALNISGKQDLDDDFSILKVSINL